MSGQESVASTATCYGTKNQPEAFETEVFPCTSARDVRAKMLIFPVFGGPDRSSWPDVRRDIWPTTSPVLSEAAKYTK